MNPSRTLASNLRTAAIIGGLALSVVVSACGDDDSETAEAWGARIDTDCPGSDPGFDGFYSEHPEPTAADYAEFLPQPRDMVADLAECIADSNPPDEVADEVDAVVDAMEVVVADLDRAIEAAEAGDLDETEQWVGQMHDVDQPKIDVAVAAVGAAIEGSGE